MISEIVRSQKPEEKELIKKLAELADLEDELTQRELELTILSAEIRAFEAVYLRRIGVRYAKLDELEARIAEAQARLNPQDSKTAERVMQARRRAQESANATSNVPDIPQKNKSKSSDRLKMLYREVAKKIHPDLCCDEDERLRRQKIMAEVNRAYEDGDEERLHRILSEWESSPEAVKGEDIGAKLVRTLRKIAQIAARLQQIATEIDVLQKSDLYQLKVRVREASPERDLLAEIGARLDAEIAAAEYQLRELTERDKSD